MTYQLDLGEDAEADIDDVLEWSVFRFGESVRDGYQALIGATPSRALRVILNSPDRMTGTTSDEVSARYI